MVAALLCNAFGQLWPVRIVVTVQSRRIAVAQEKSAVYLKFTTQSVA